MRAGLGNVRQERVGEEDDLLLGLPGIHRVDREQFRRQFAGFGLARLADRDAGIGCAEVVVELGRDLDDLPPVRTVQPTVGREQTLQQRSSAAHHPDDDDRRLDLLVENLGVPADPLLGAKADPQAVHDAGPDDLRANSIEIGVGVVGQQDLERLLEFSRAPVGEAFLALRLRQHGGQVESTRIVHAFRTSGAG